MQIHDICTPFPYFSAPLCALVWAGSVVPQYNHSVLISNSSIRAEIEHHSARLQVWEIRYFLLLGGSPQNVMSACTDGYCILSPLNKSC